MSIILATPMPLHPDTVSQLHRIHPLLNDLYAGIAIVTPPNQDEALVAQVQALSNITLLQGTQPHENRRYLCIQQALTFADATHVHYCDGDHVLTRLEPHLDDWKRLLAAMRHTDCLVVGRSDDVFESYPDALKETERIINRVVSQLMGMPVDLGSGSRGFSRRAAAYLVDHASPDTHAIATDSEWVMLLHRAGFSVESFISKGAIYKVFDDDHRARLENVAQWSKRVAIAQMIIDAALAVNTRDDIVPGSA